MLQSCWMLVAAMLFATMSSLVKMSAGEIVFYRSLIGLVFIAIVMFIQGQTPHTKYLFGHIKRSVLGTLAFTIWFFTMGHLPLGTAVTLNYTAPLFIAATLWSRLSCITKKRHGHLLLPFVWVLSAYV